ncbi:hypothetical protein ASE27_06335 [Oerskovia sp. Root918]|nr:hypothetical protein ASE27_06335 [Oerskovia sp. Root918]
MTVVTGARARSPDHGLDRRESTRMRQHDRGETWPTQQVFADTRGRVVDRTRTGTYRRHSTT